MREIGLQVCLVAFCLSTFLQAAPPTRNCANFSPPNKFRLGNMLPHSRTAKLQMQNTTKKLLNLTFATGFRNGSSAKNSSPPCRGTTPSRRSASASPSPPRAKPTRIASSTKSPPAWAMLNSNFDSALRLAKRLLNCTLPADGSRPRQLRLVHFQSCPILG